MIYDFIFLLIFFIGIIGLEFIAYSRFHDPKRDRIVAWAKKFRWPIHAIFTLAIFFVGAAFLKSHGETSGVALYLSPFLWACSTTFIFTVPCKTMEDSSKRIACILKTAIAVSLISLGWLSAYIL